LNLRAESRAAMCSNNGRQCAAYSTPRCARMAYRRSVGGAQARTSHALVRATLLCVRPEGIGGVVRARCALPSPRPNPRAPGSHRDHMPEVQNETGCHMEHEQPLRVTDIHGRNQENTESNRFESSLPDQSSLDDVRDDTSKIRRFLRWDRVTLRLIAPTLPRRWIDIRLSSAPPCDRASRREVNEQGIASAYGL
jgi:hypothetical protein